ncbi:hypothetical protein ACWERV_16910 [Streptomyces sp. NPDC004031]
MAPDPEADHTFSTKFRIPRRMWDTYGRVLGDRDRSADLLDHVRTVIATHGTDEDRAELAAADTELAERRARKGGRPRTANAVAKVGDAAVRAAAAFDEVAASAGAEAASVLARAVAAQDGTWDTGRAVTALRDAGVPHGAGDRAEEKQARTALRVLADEGVLVQVDSPGSAAVYRRSDLR